MSEAALKLLPMLEALTDEERDELGRHMGVLDDESISQDEWEEAWGREVERRIADFEAGRSHLIDAEEVFRIANEILKNETVRVRD